MRRLLPATMAVLAVLLCGALQGAWSGRWAPSSHALDDAAARVARVPLTIGDWEGRELGFDRRIKEGARLAGGIMRRYENHKTGEALSVMLVCGPSGPIAAHTPEVCFPGNGFRMAEGRTRRSVPEPGVEGPAEFYRARFARTTSPVPDSQIVLFSWDARGRWEAPEGDARGAFARYPVLYKLYVVREVAGADDRASEDVAVDFLRDFLPAFRATQAPAS
jgi:hypothetical protein